MGSAKLLAAAGAATLLSLSSAFAADLRLPPPPPIPEFGGWYLRGDIGMSNQRFSGLEHPDFASAASFAFVDKGGFDSGMIYGLGVGYQFSSWLRFDVRGEYRGSVGFHALDHFDNGGTFNANSYTGSKSEWVVLANAYLDLGTWWSITPFIGAGIGAADISIAHFRDDNIIAGGGGWAPSGQQTNLAWALYAGAAYRVTPGFTVELAYRYLNMGDGKTGVLQNLDPTFVSGNPLAPMTFNNIYSHDIMLGMRWMLEPEPVYQPPLVRKG